MAVQHSLEVAEASDAERDEVLAHTHALWGGKRSLEGYRAQQVELLRSPWGSKHYRFNVGKDNQGRIVTDRLLAAPMRDFARRDFVLATLFSDIDPCPFRPVLDWRIQGRGG